MQKYLKHTVYIFIISLFAMVCLSRAKTFIFIPFLQKYIYAKTGYEVKLDDFCISPFSLTLMNVTANGAVAMQKIKFKFKLTKFFAYIASPLKLISRVDISKLEICLNESLKTGNIFLDKENIADKLPDSGITLFADETVIKNNTGCLKIANTNMLIKPCEIDVDSVIYILGIPVKFSSSIKLAPSGSFNTFAAFTADSKVNILVNSCGTLDLSSLNMTQDIAVEKLAYNGFSLNGAFGAFSKKAGSYDVGLWGNFGKFKFNYLPDHMFKAESDVDISKINGSMSGNINLNFKGLNRTRVLGLNVTKLAVMGFNCGDFNFLGTKNCNGACNASCMYGNSKKVELAYAENGNYKLKVVVKNRTRGVVEGNIKTGGISVDIRNINIEDIPVMPFMFKNTKGVVNIFGSMGKVSGRINFALKRFSLSGMGNTDIKGSIVRNNEVCVFNFCKSANSAILKGVAKNGRIISAVFKFAGIDILNLLRIFKCSRRGISGTASGCLKYRKSGLMEFDIKAFDGLLYGNEFKKFEANGDVNLGRLKIERFVLKSGSNKIMTDMTGLVGFTKVNPVSSVCVQVNDLKLGKLKASGYAVFHGNLIGGKKIKGIVKSTKTSISGLAFGNVVASVEVSPKGFRIQNLKADNGINAHIVADFRENKLSGKACFKNANIAGIYPGVSGFLNSVVEFSGRLSKPDVNVPAFSAKGSYLSYFFSFSSRFAYKNNAAEVNCTTLFVDKIKITLRRGRLKDRGLFLSFTDITGEIARAASDSNSPLKHFSGDSAALKAKQQCLKMSLKVASACIGALKLNDIKSDVGVTGDSVEINSASVKILNSEIRVGKSFFNISSGKYGLSLFLANVHVGPADLFGNIKLLGEVTKQKENFLLIGTIALRDLWVNSYNLLSYDFGYKLEDKTLRFFHKTNGTLCNFSGLIVFGDIVSLKEFNISKGEASFNLNGNFSRDSIDIRARNSNTDWRLITDILNLPRLAEGNANIVVNLLRNVNGIRGDISIASVDGSIIGIPYDTFEVEMDFSDSCARIKKAIVLKQGELNVSVSGNFPFWFSGALFEKMQKEPINVFYEVEDYKLNILKYLSAGFIKNHSGKMFLKGSITGTYGKLSNRGKLLIKEGYFGVKDYIDKVKNMSVEISIDENLVKIDKFDFRSGYGKLNVYGQLVLNNFNIGDFDLRFVTDSKGISLHAPQLPMHSVVGSKSPLQDYSTGRPCFDIRIWGTPEEPKVSGWVLLKDTRFTLPGNTGNSDADFIIPENTEFDLELRAAKTTQFENSFVSALISGSVRLKGFYKNLSARGMIKSSSGIIYYLGTGFRVLNAKLEISDDDKVYITAECEDEKYSKKLIIARSEISDIYIKEPSQKILGEVVETEQKTQPDLPKLEPKLNFVIGQQVLHLLNENVAIPIVKTVLRKFRIIDNFVVSYNPIVTGVFVEERPTVTNLFLGMRYSVEKNLTNRILIGYSVTFDRFIRKFGLIHNVEMKYKLAKGLFLSGNYEYIAEKQFHRPASKLMLQYQINFWKSAK